MRVLLQRVSKASVTIEAQVVGSIGQGLVVLVGFESADTKEDIEWLSKKISRLRIFNDDAGVMNLSVRDVQGGLLVISQFTLHASTKKGNRPSYMKAARPESAMPLYAYFIEVLAAVSGVSVETGEFGAEMQVALVNDGPVTIFIDSKNRE